MRHWSGSDAVARSRDTILFNSNEPFSSKYKTNRFVQVSAGGRNILPKLLSQISKSKAPVGGALTLELDSRIDDLKLSIHETLDGTLISQQNSPQY